MINIYFDGGTRGNRVCVVDSKTNSEMVHNIQGMKELTNNQMEYYAVWYALRHIVNNYKDVINDVRLKGDSQLVIRHLQGKFKVRSPKLIDLYQQVMELIGEVKLPIENIIWVPRDENLAGKVLE